MTNLRYYKDMAQFKFFGFYNGIMVYLWKLLAGIVPRRIKYYVILEQWTYITDLTNTEIYSVTAYDLLHYLYHSPTVLDERPYLEKLESSEAVKEPLLD